LYEAVDEPIWTSQIPIEIERDQFFLPTVIRANDVIKKNFVFSSGITEMQINAVLYNFELEAKISGLANWRKLKHIELDLRDQGEFSIFELNAYYRVYRYRKGERA
jgi:heme oxygenase